jgi:cell shape-determining protein MreD
MLWFPFLLSTVALFVQAVFSLPFVLFVYAPWLCLCVLRSSGLKSLYLAFLAGSLMDLIGNDPMGVHALNYVLVVAGLYRFRKLFLVDHTWHLSLFTWMFSLSSTLLQLFLLFLFDRRVPFAGQWVLGDLIVMPLADALYAFVWITLPILGVQTMKIQGRVQWNTIKNRLFPTTH